MLAELIVGLSTVHLKMKYYTSKGLVTTLHRDNEAAKRCFKTALRGLNIISASTNNKLALPNSSEEHISLPRFDSIDLENCFSRDDLKD